MDIKLRSGASIGNTEHMKNNLAEKLFFNPVYFFEICPTYDGLVSKALPLRLLHRGGFLWAIPVIIIVIILQNNFISIVP